MVTTRRPSRRPSRRSRSGPRQASRWIGDAFVLDGDLATGAPAVWRGPLPGAAALPGVRHEPRCARVRIAEMSRDWEFDVDEEPLYRAGAELRDARIVPRLATYREQDLVAIVDDDAGDVTLADLVAALREHGANGHAAPPGLALYAMRECALACAAAAAQGVVLADLRPARIALAWDGRVLLRPSLRAAAPGPAWDDELDHGFDDEPDPLTAALYDHRDQRQVLAVLACALLTGRDPFGARAGLARDDDDDDGGGAGDDDDDDGDDDDDEIDTWQRADAVRDRMRRGDFDVAPLDAALGDSARDVLDLLARLLAPAPASASRTDALVALVAAVEALLEVHPFTQRDLAGLLRGLFADTLRACELEREDRLLVMPAPHVEPEAWQLFEEASPASGHDEVELYDLDDVRRGHPDFDGARFEPSVDAIDPFEDDT